LKRIAVLEIVGARMVVPVPKAASAVLGSMMFEDLIFVHY
jgi:hypothetical protein